MESRTAISLMSGGKIKTTTMANVLSGKKTLLVEGDTDVDFYATVFRPQGINVEKSGNCYKVISSCFNGPHVIGLIDNDLYILKKCQDRLAINDRIFILPYNDLETMQITINKYLCNTIEEKYVDPKKVDDFESKEYENLLNLINYFSWIYRSYGYEHDFGYYIEDHLNDTYVNSDLSIKKEAFEFELRQTTKSGSWDIPEYKPSSPFEYFHGHIAIVVFYFILMKKYIGKIANRTYKQLSNWRKEKDTEEQAIRYRDRIENDISSGAILPFVETDIYKSIINYGKVNASSK